MLLALLGPVQPPAQDFATVYRPAPLPPGMSSHAGAKLAMDDGAQLAGLAGAAYDYVSREGLGWFGYPRLAEMAQRAEFRRPVETLAKEMTRRWIKLNSTADDDDTMNEKLKLIEGAFQHFKVKEMFRNAAELDGFFGRAQIFIDTGTEGEELAKPLLIDKRKIAKGGLKGFKVIEPIWTYPNRYEATNPLHSHYYKPQSWFVMGKEVHSTRLLTFVSRPLPDILKPAYAFGGLALTQMATPYVENWLRTRQSVSDLLHAFSIVQFATDLDSLLEDGAQLDLIKRLDLFNKTRDNRSLMVRDKDKEELDIAAVPLGTLDKLQAQSQEQMAAVVGIPLVILLGITPSGLNASSEGEIRVFYSWIGAQQEAVFSDNLTKILQIIQLHLFGEIDPNIGFEYVPLWELDAVQESTVRKTDSETAAAYINAGVLHPEETRRRLARDPKSGYNDIDVEDVPEPPQTPEDDPPASEAA